MDCLSPSMKKRPAVITISANLKAIRALAAAGHLPTQSDVERMRELADEAMSAALARQLEIRQIPAR